MDPATALFMLVIVVFSAIVHEVMHGYAAEALGDPTARYAGRLTLNPIPHLDLFGSILFPLLLVLSGSPILFGYAKPVPYNPYNLKAGRFSEAIVAGAGPAANLGIVLVFSVVTRLHLFGPSLESLFFAIVLINVMLFLFNLIPVPPLDGSKVLEALLPRAWTYSYARWRRTMEMNPFIGMLVVVLIVYGLGTLWASLIYGAASSLTGVGIMS